MHGACPPWHQREPWARAQARVAHAPSPQCCRALVSHHVDHSLRDEDGYTAADLAEYHGHQDCAQYLRETARQVSLARPHPPGVQGDRARCCPDGPVGWRAYCAVVRQRAWARAI